MEKEMKELDLSKPVQTRNGRPVRILCTDAKGPYPIVGLMPSGEAEHVGSWMVGGNSSPYSWTQDDLINVPEPKRYVWLNVYRDGASAALYTSRNEADRYEVGERVGCIKVELVERFDD